MLLKFSSQEREPEYKSYGDINQWWRGEGTCIKGSWKKFQVRQFHHSLSEVEYFQCHLYLHSEYGDGLFLLNILSFQAALKRKETKEKPDIDDKKVIV